MQLQYVIRQFNLIEVKLTFYTTFAKASIVVIVAEHLPHYSKVNGSIHLLPLHSDPTKNKSSKLILAKQAYFA